MPYDYTAEELDKAWAQVETELRSEAHTALTSGRITEAEHDRMLHQALGKLPDARLHLIKGLTWGGNLDTWSYDELHQLIFIESAHRNAGYYAGQDHCECLSYTKGEGKHMCWHRLAYRIARQLHANRQHKAEPPPNPYRKLPADQIQKLVDQLFEV